MRDGATAPTGGAARAQKRPEAESGGDEKKKKKKNKKRKAARGLDSDDVSLSLSCKYLLDYVVTVPGASSHRPESIFRLGRG